MRNALLAALFISALGAGCSSPTDHEVPPWAGYYLFEPGTSLTIRVDKMSFEVGEEIKVSFTCRPAYTGKGSLRIEFLPIKQSAWYQGIIVENPEVTSKPGYSFEAPAEFTAGERYTRTWTIRVGDATAHEVYGGAYFSSVWIEEKGGCFPIRSDEASAAYGMLDTRPAYLFMFMLPEPR